MKKQINPSIKAHLLWSALVLLSLLAICAIPFALAQSRGRGTNNRSVANRSDEAQLRINKDGAFGMPAFSILPRTPDVVLYDQLNNPGSQSTNSQSVFNDQAADDFVVPSGQTWNITEVDVQGVYFDCSNPCGPADSFNFYFYRDFGGLPGPILLGIGGTSYVNNSGVFQIPVSPSQLVLGPGRYWVSVQANMSSANGRWGWTDRTVQTNSPAAWQNPGGNVCSSWNARTTCVGDAAAPDQMFQLGGTIGGGTPTPEPTGTPSPTPSGTPSPSCTPNPIPTPGACTTYEAESCNNTLTGSAFVLNCPTCSGGQKVGYVGNNSGTLQFNDVFAVAPGRYSTTICYTNGDAVRYALLSVNGSPGTPLSFPSTGSFQTVGSIQTTITLNTGNNTLEFHNPIVGSWAPDFDRIQFNCPTCAAATLGNISTRSFVQTGDNAMIGGFIVRGAGTKRVILRAIGPELTQYGVPDPLQDPTLELHNANGALIASNNDWQHTIIGGIITSDQVQEIQNTGHAPGDPSESSIVANLSPGNYTAIVRGVNNTTGAALVEVYDLNLFSGSFLGNISTRSFVQTGDKVMIGGFIVEGTQARSVIIRAIGPELSQYGVPDPLQNPTLELHNGSGALIASNDNWQHTIIGGIITQDQVQNIQNSGHAPGAASESAIIANLPPGNYTAIVRGVNNTIGVALVEVYDLH